MTKVARTILKISCALLLLGGLAHQPALADCAGSVFFGDFSALTAVRLDVSDPAAFWMTYMFQNPAINQGAARVSDVAFDNAPLTGPGTALVFNDWGAGLGMAGCPLSLDGTGGGAAEVPPILDDESLLGAAQEVFIFGDSRGTTLIVTGSANGNVFDFDTTSATGGVLGVTTLKPRVVSAVTGASVTVTLAWDPPAINVDSLSSQAAGRLIAGYQIIENRTSGGTTTHLPLVDADGSTTNNGAVVTLASGTSLTDSSTLSVQAQLAGATGLGPTFMGTASSPIRTFPGLAIPKTPQGKGKGLTKAPGQQK